MRYTFFADHASRFTLYVLRLTTLHTQTHFPLFFNRKHSIFSRVLAHLHHRVSNIAFGWRIDYDAAYDEQLN
jgi:hypothetical protein